MEIAQQDIKKLKGLSDAEAFSRLKETGYNELPSAKKRGIINIIVEVFCEPMFLLLVACGTLYLILGDVGEALMLMGFVFVIIGITIYQENKTEKALDALKDLASPRALVIREGSEKRIAGREVVVNDLIIIKEGDRVLADAVLIWGMNLTSDESLLTGESVPVRKNPSEQIELEILRPGGDDLPFIYSGFFIVQGQGVAQVLSTGINTEIGKIGKALHGIEEEKTALQKETGKIVKTVFIFAAVLIPLCLQNGTNSRPIG